jgi:hypothetical protein
MLSCESTEAEKAIMDEVEDNKPFPKKVLGLYVGMSVTDFKSIIYKEGFNITEERLDWGMDPDYDLLESPVVFSENAQGKEINARIYNDTVFDIVLYDFYTEATDIMKAFEGTNNAIGNGEHFRKGAITTGVYGSDDGSYSIHLENIEMANRSRKHEKAMQEDINAQTRGQYE